MGTTPPFSMEGWGGPTVKFKVTGVNVPNDAVTLAGPGALPRVTWVLARPARSVCTIAGLTTALVAANDTATPATGFPSVSLTATTAGFGRGSPAGPLWPSPDTTLMDAGGRGPLLQTQVSSNRALPGGGPAPPKIIACSCME